MDEFQSLSHTKWDCKYHVVFIPKCRRRTLYAQLRKDLGEVFRRLASQRESRIEEGHLMCDHVHMMISIPLPDLRTFEGCSPGDRPPDARQIRLSRQSCTLLLLDERMAHSHTIAAGAAELALGAS